MLNHTKKFTFAIVLFTQSTALALADMNVDLKKDYLSLEELKEYGVKIEFNKRDDLKNPVAYAYASGGCSDHIILRKDKEGNLVAAIANNVVEPCSEKEKTKSKTVKFTPGNKVFDPRLLSVDEDCENSDDHKDCGKISTTLLEEKWHTLSSKDKETKDRKLKTQCEELKAKVENEKICATCNIENQESELRLTEAKQTECSQLKVYFTMDEKKSALEAIKQKLACEKPVREFESSDLEHLLQKFETVKDKLSEGNCADSQKLQASIDLLNLRIAKARPKTSNELNQFLELVDSTKETTGIKKSDVYVLLANDENYWKSSLDPKLSQSIQSGLNVSLNTKYLECEKTPSDFCKMELSILSQSATKNFEGLNNQSGLIQANLQKQNELIWKCQTGKLEAAQCAEEYRKMQLAGRMDLKQIPGMSRYDVLNNGMVAQNASASLNPGLAGLSEAPVSNPAMSSSGLQSGMYTMSLYDAGSSNSSFYQLPSQLPTTYVETSIPMGQPR